MLKSDFPEYTGLNRLSQSSGLEHKKVQGLQTTIPAETRFLFHCQVNKPLVNVRLDFGPNELVFGDFLNSTSDASGREFRFKASLTTRSLEGGPAERTKLSFDVAGRYLPDDRMSFTVPFVASRGKTEATRQRKKQSFPTYGKPFVLAEDYEMRIYLEDADGIRTVDPTKLMINAVPDSPPEFIDVEFFGVDTIVTHRVDIPVRGIIADDYGIAVARFEFQIDDETESWIPRPFDNPPEEYPKEFTLQRGPDQKFERFSVLPLDLKIGQKLALTVYAEDEDNLNGPNAGRSKRFTFTIVSVPDLAMSLFDKEINAKKQFEQIRDEVQETRDVLELQQRRITEAKQLREKGPEPGKEQEHRDRLDAIAKGLAVAAETRLHQVRKNAAETAAVEEAFRSILQELQNNKVPGGDRIKSDVVDPLEGITKDDFPSVDSAVNQFRLDNEKGRDPTAKIDESINETENLLRNMDSVLQGMQDIVEFHQMIKILETIIREQEAIEQNTADEQKKSLRKRLGGD